MNKILVLFDCKHPPVFISKTEYIGGVSNVIDKLRKPHGRCYDFRTIYFDDLETEEEESAWAILNTANVPNTFDISYPQHEKAFNYFWEKGGELIL